MLKLLIPTMMMIPSAMLLKEKTMFTTLTFYSMLLTLLSTQLLYTPMMLNSTFSNKYLFIDQISAPLTILSYWLVPMMIMASQHHLKNETNMRKRWFMTNMLILQVLLVMAFSANNMMLFFILFEATMIPTLIMITRWGNQPKRLTAGNYFIFYTTTTSVPLLIAILLSHNQGTLNFITTNVMPQNNESSNILWTAYMLAFLTKMPMYGLHLWLPKAHVEAPIAGSMVLAAILLKLGGYGIIRMHQILPQPTLILYPTMALALWGMIMTGTTCLQKTDLKALIAYSSVGHMALVTTATLIQTPQSISGATMMMIAHGLTSSMLFCLANMLYERTNTRMLVALRGMHKTMPLMTFFWLISSLTNMALPPTINFMGEIKIMTTLYNWSPMTMIPVMTGTMITAIYSLQMFMNTQQGHLQNDLEETHPAQTRELLILLMHAIPMILITLSPQLIS